MEKLRVMLKNIPALCIAVILLALISGTKEFYADEPPVMMVNVEEINVRSAPDSNSGLCGTLPAGTLLPVLSGVENGYVLVQIGDGQAYVCYKYLSPVPEPEKQPLVADNQGAVLEEGAAPGISAAFLLQYNSTLDYVRYFVVKNNIPVIFEPSRSNVGAWAGITRYSYWPSTGRVVDGSVRIYVAPGNSYNTVIYHEIGHAVDVIIGVSSGTVNGSKRMSNTNEFQLLYATESPSGLTEYGKTSAGEYFCESFMEYYTNPQALMERCPGTYLYMQNINAILQAQAMK